MGGKTIAIFDLDRTVTIRDTYIPFLYHCLLKHPSRLLRVPLLGVAVLMHFMKWKGNSWLKDFFLRKTLGGLSEQEIRSCTKTYIPRILKYNIRPGAMDAMQRHKKEGHKLMLLTASFDLYVSPLANILGFDAVICSQTQWDEGHLVGMAGDNCYGTTKVSAAKNWFSNTRSGWTVYAYTDHHSDLPLLHWAEIPWAINPNEKLKSAAREHSIPVEDWGP